MMQQLPVGRPRRILLPLLLLVCGSSCYISVSHAFSISTRSVFSPVNIRAQQRNQSTSRSSLTLPSQTLVSIQRRDSYSSSSSALYAFLPPSGGSGGGGNGGKSSDLKDIAVTALTLVGVVAFLASPLGAILFTLVNSFFALLILLPLGGLVAFNVWQYLNVTTGTCPNCQAPVKVLKDGSEASLCFNCGSVVQLRDGQVYLANLNNLNNDVLSDDAMTRPGSGSDGGDSIFASLFQRPTGSSQSSSASTSTDKKRTTTVIDVDAKRED